MSYDAFFSFLSKAALRTQIKRKLLFHRTSQSQYFLKKKNSKTIKWCDIQRFLQRQVANLHPYIT